MGLDSYAKKATQVLGSVFASKSAVAKPEVPAKKGEPAGTPGTAGASVAANTKPIDVSIPKRAPASQDGTAEAAAQWSQPEPVRFPKAVPQDFPAGLALLEADVEYVRAQVEGLKQNRELLGERFAHISEERGELRALIVELERGNAQLRVAAEKVSALVEATQPQKLRTEVNKIAAPAESARAVDARRDAFEREASEGLRALREKVSALAAAQADAAKSFEDAKTGIAEVRKAEMMLKREAEKAEARVSESEKRAGAISAATTKVDALTDNLRSLAKSVEELKVRAETAPPRKEIDAERARISEGLRKVETAVSDMTEFKELFATLFASELERLREENKDAFDEFSKRILYREAVQKHA